jgi:CO/xanthine dehydrogenase Mo-binding subunit
MYAATSDIGQGLEAMMRLVFCRAMGDLSPELVRWMPPSTSTSPDAGSTGASRQTSVTGNAVWGAARDLRQQIINLAAEMLETPSEEIEMQGGQLWDAQHELHLSEVLEEARRRGLDLEGKYRFIAPPTTSLDENGQGYPVNQYCYATQIAKVDVDADTGEVQVLSVAAFIDAGRIINPLGAKKQSEGGIVMGLGYALTEEFLMTEGKPINEGLTNYLIPTIYDAPPTISTRFVGESIPFGELGTRGLAEITMVPTAPAIVNAIYNATGARLHRIPATPERILEVLERSHRPDEGR